MLTMNHDLLRGAGLGGLPPEQSQVMLRSLYATLERRVDARMVDGLTAVQIDDFAACVERSAERGALGWLELSRRDYREVVRAELEALKQEISARAGDVLRAAADARRCSA